MLDEEPLEEYPLLEEKIVGSAPVPNPKPLDEELLEAGTVMHADIAIAPRLHNITAATRATQLIRLIIFQCRSFAIGTNPLRRRANSLELGPPPRIVLASTLQEIQAMYPVRHLTCSHSLTAVASAVLFAACAGAAAGCFTDKRPTQVMVTQVAPVIHPAKAPDCNMPVLTEEPASYQEIAIVEAWSDVNADPAKILPELKRQACGTGAEALLIVSGKKQNDKKLLYGVTPNQNETNVTSENRTPNQAGDYINTMQYTPKIGEGGHIGYYIDALAIDYPAGANTAAAGQPSKP